MFNNLKKKILQRKANCQKDCCCLGKHSLDRISLDLFTWSKVSVKFGVWSNALFVTWSKVLLINFLCSHLIELFLCFHLIESFINVIFELLKLSIKWKNLSVLFWHLIKSSNNGILGFKNFRSSAKNERTNFFTWLKVFKLIEWVLMANF